MEIRRTFQACRLAIFASLWQLWMMPALVDTFAINNEVLGQPQVQCSEDSVTLSVRTRDKFQGNMFIKGKYNVPQCRQEYFSNQANLASFTVKIGDCGMQRERQLQPHGMNYKLVFVISFHQQFITKVDKAYNVRCFYQQIDKTVTTQLEVSMISTTELYDSTMIMPNCEYSIRSGTVNGPRVRYAQVGDRLVHRWECDNTGLYGFLVKNCFVNDGAGTAVRVLDARGCPVFTPVIQGIPDYHDNIASVEVWAYKFPDRADLYFQCQIQVCMRRENECLGVTPPNCPNVLRPDFRGENVDPGVTDSLGRIIIPVVPGYAYPTTPLQPFGFSGGQNLVNPGGYNSVGGGSAIPPAPAFGGSNNLPFGVISGGSNVQTGQQIQDGNTYYPSGQLPNPLEPLRITPDYGYTPYPSLGLGNLQAGRPYSAKDEPSNEQQAVRFSPSVGRGQSFEAQIVEKPINASKLFNVSSGRPTSRFESESEAKVRRSAETVHSDEVEMNSYDNMEGISTTLSANTMASSSKEPWPVSQTNGFPEDVVDVTSDLVYIVDLEENADRSKSSRKQDSIHPRKGAIITMSDEDELFSGNSYTCFNASGLVMLAVGFATLLLVITGLLICVFKAQCRHKHGNEFTWTLPSCYRAARKLWQQQL